MAHLTASKHKDYMAKDRNIRKKTKSRPYEPWHGDCERFGNHKHRMSAEYEVNPPRTPYRRKKKKNILLIAKPTGDPKPRWWMKKGTYVFGRYERFSDAEKALRIHSRKDRWPGAYYTFYIVDNR